MLSIEEIKLLIEKLKVLKRKNFNVLIDENLKVLENLHEALEKNEWNLARPSKKSRSWFIKDLEYKKENPYVNELLANLIQKKIYQFGRVNLYNSLEIGPGNGQFSMDFRTWRLNYFLDICADVEAPIRKMFPVQHQKYLKFLRTIEDNANMDSIPRGSCNFVFSWDTFVFFTQEHIKQYLHNMNTVLIPGGYCFIQYADCHYDLDLQQSKRGYWNYNTKTAMTQMIKDEGYEVVEMSQFCPGANYAIFRKPGKQNPVVYKVSELVLD
tara:strand:- start:73 stop:876 length:804 start_codon:yes stop_codon:yes gene_type:complete